MFYMYRRSCPFSAALPPLHLLFLPFSRPSPSACAIPAVAHYTARPAACSSPPPFSVRFRYPYRCAFCRPSCRLLFTAALLRPIALSLPVAHSAARPATCSLPPPFSVRFRYPCRCALCRPFSAVLPLLFLSAAPHCPPFFSSCRLSVRLFYLNALPARDFVL